MPICSEIMKIHENVAELKNDNRHNAVIGFESWAGGGHYYGVEHYKPHVEHLFVFSSFVQNYYFESCEIVHTSSPYLGSRHGEHCSD